jgi:hypothetical protein
MSKIKILESRKLLKELEYIESDFEYKTEIIGEADSYFMKTVNSFLSNHPELKDKFDKSINEKMEMMVREKEDESLNKSEYKDNSESNLSDEVNEFNEVIDIVNDVKSDKIKKLYRDIVKVTHPDKTSNKKLNDIYIKSTSYYDDNNLPGIYSVCNKLEIEYDIDDDDTLFISGRIGLMKERIGFMESTFTWKWYNSSSDSEKQNILLSYIKSQLF